MDQKFDAFSINKQIEQLFEEPQGSLKNDVYYLAPSDLDTFNDSIALQSFITSVHGAFRANDEQAIKMTLDILNSSHKYPNLHYAIQAYTSFQYQAAIFAANLARQQALKDTSVNRNFAYCAACLLIAHASERLGEDTAVINTLLECKDHLELEIGQIATQWMKKILDSFYPRWGIERLQTALLAVQKQT